MRLAKPPAKRRTEEVPIPGGPMADAIAALPRHPREPQIRRCQKCRAAWSSRINPARCVFCDTPTDAPQTLFEDDPFVSGAVRLPGR